jgi:hypothetical protein
VLFFWAYAKIRSYYIARVRTMTEAPHTSPQHNAPKQIAKCQNIISILWPSFLVSGATLILIFAAFDPSELMLCMDMDIELDRMGAYSSVFLALWFMNAISCMSTCFFKRPCHVPRPPVNDDEDFTI